MEMHKTDFVSLMRNKMACAQRTLPLGCFFKQSKGNEYEMGFFMKRKLVLAALLAAAVGLTACAGTANPETDTVSEDAVEVTAEETTEEVTEPPTNAPVAEGDANACTFDEVGEDIAVVVADDDTAADGTLSIAEIDGNKMLKFTDKTTTADNIEDRVQKLRFDITKLLAPEQLELVNTIEFDLYAEAKDTVYVNEDGEAVKAPGWIGGGGGTETCDGKWYGFTDFAGSGIQEYVLERSDACHVSFKFLLASSGRKWDAAMTEPYLQIMRWGMGNISDLYVDNITFFDADGNSIPLTISDGWAVSDDAENDEDAEDASAETAADETTDETTPDSTEESTPMEGTE